MPEILEFEVPELGRFTFRERTSAEHLRLQQEFRKQSTGITDSDLLLALEAVVVCPAVMETMPEGFSFDDMDPLDSQDWVTLGAIYGGLRKAEDDFRKARPKSGARAWRGTGGERRVAVPPPLQPAPE